MPNAVILLWSIPKISPHSHLSEFCSTVLETESIEIKFSLTLNALRILVFKILLNTFQQLRIFQNMFQLMWNKPI